MSGPEEWFGFNLVIAATTLAVDIKREIRAFYDSKLK